MDEKIEKAFSVANYMATLTNQRRIILEEYNQSLLYYKNGATFKVTPELISLVKTCLDLEKTTDIVFVDLNNLPVVVSSVNDFFNDITELYFKSTSEYNEKYNNIKSKRKIADLIDL
jgi:hypothetical protein